MQRPKSGQEQLREFGRRVQDRRIALSRERALPLSQERLGELAGLHRTYIGHVERGEVNPALWNILRIAAALEVDPSELVRDLRP